MTILDTIFGRKKRTAATISVEIEAQRSAVASAQTRIERARADRLAAIEAMDATRHRAAEEEIAEAEREIVRRDHAINALQAAHVAAVEAEAAASLRAMAEVAHKRVDTETMPLIARYEALAAEIVKVAAELQGINGDVDRANVAIRQARKADPNGSHPDLVATATARFRTIPDSVDPDRTVKEERRVIGDERTGYKYLMSPDEAGARVIQTERVIPGRVRKGRSLPCPTYSLVLPPARLDAPAFWPRQA